jgi:hypothetical protein
MAIRRAARAVTVVAVGVLRQGGDHQVLAPDHLAARRRLGALQEAQERRLAGAVRTDDADPGPVGHLEIGSP